MNRLARVFAIAFLLALLLPELPRYRAEAVLADAHARLDAVLHGQLRGTAARDATAQALVDAQRAGQRLPGDPRAPLAEGLALLFQQRGREAAAVLTAAIAQGERPELTLNLGRARGISGDAAGADAAFLRTAWASPASIATLPAAMRADLSQRVGTLETALREGRLEMAPPLH